MPFRENGNGRAGSATAPGHQSVAFPKRWWYPACRSSDLGSRPLAIELMDTPLALFRSAAGRPHALVDRCPHRNVPLSMGRVHADGRLECGYHGWRFDGSGRCRAVPGLAEGEEPAPAHTAAYPATEQDGFVWVWGDPDAPPGERRPFPLPHLGEGAGQVVFARDLDCNLHAALENALDVPHTAFLHKGLLRGAEPSQITAVRREVPGGVEVQFDGEPFGLGRFRGRPGQARTLDHWDRFFLPSIAQIEYRADSWLHIFNTILHLPLSAYRTRAWFVLAWTSKLPRAVVKPIVVGRGWRVLGQDAAMLARQAENVRRFGGERYTSTELDLLGTSVWRLLRGAERDETAEAGSGGATAPVGISERRVTFRA